MELDVNLFAFIYQSRGIKKICSDIQSIGQILEETQQPSKRVGAFFGGPGRSPGSNRLFQSSTRHFQKNQTRRRSIEPTDTKRAGVFLCQSIRLCIVEVIEPGDNLNTDSSNFNPEYLDF